MRPDEDDGMLQELRRLASDADPVPAAVVEAAKAALDWRTVDAELTELAAVAFDSAVDQRELALVRGGAEPRLLTFEAPGLTIEIEVSAAGPRRHLVGQLVPPQPAEIVIRHSNGTMTVEADGLGRFSASEVSAGSISLRCHLAGKAPGNTVVTDWIAV